MTSPAWHSNAIDYDNPPHDDDHTPAFGDLAPGEPISGRRKSSGRIKRLLKALTLIGAGTAWSLYGDTAALVKTISPLIKHLTPPPAAPAQPTEQLKPDPLKSAEAPAPGAALPELPAAATPDTTATPNTPPPAKTADQPAASTAYEETKPEPLAPIKSDPANPYHKRATAVGLHPELSRVVLAKLTAADYRNAGVAIETALAQTADDATFTWPSKPKPDQAVFEVHFVAGTSKDCRRYVVTVALDRWLTTAPPMENCNSQRQRTKT
jgi:hypothetical protein